jgi:O-antigen ligase
VLILFLLTFAIGFYLEGLWRSRLMPALVLCSILGAAVLIPFVDHLPLSVQRTLSFLPLQVDPVAKASAQSSTEWRIMIWKHLLPQIPDYLILGKGYGINVNDFEMVRMTRTENSGAMGSELAGDYHSGPLSVIIPFGIFGSIAFLWFLIGSLRALYHNYQYGDPALLQINRFLFAYFLAKIVFFFSVFGSLYSDMATFTGLIGLSLSLNGGVAKQVVPARPTLAFNRFKLQPDDRKAYGVP